MSYKLKRLLARGVILIGVLAIALAAHSYLARPKSPSIAPSVLIGEQPVMPRPTVPMATSKRSSSLAAGSNGCSTAKRPFVLQSVTIRGVMKDVKALPEKRDANGTPGTPPLTDAGKYQLAWDEPGARPGSSRGKVLVNAHTWPDGSALGNTLLKSVGVGATIVMRGSGGQQFCYSVTKRIEVAKSNYPQKLVYDESGSPQLIITVCSGLRLGPGDWANRTLWFASPMK